MIDPPNQPKGIATATVTLAGLAAAFGVAACCALPFLFASVGIGAAWLGGVAIVAAPYRTPLLVIGALCVAVVGLGYKVYQDNKEPKGLELKVGPSGVSIDKK